MKATIITILLSLLLTAGLTSCTQSDETKEIAEIQESIAKTDEILAFEKAHAEFKQRIARSKEMHKERLEQMASTPEGRAQMEKTLTQLKHTYIENDHIVFRMNLDEALKAGFTQEEYDQILKVHAWENHLTDSLNADAKKRNAIINHHFSTDYDEARNGTHEYYEYLKKYYNEHPDVPALRERK